jgi:hypothetical protein
MNELTRESVVEAARAAAAKSDGPLSFRTFLQLSGISEDRFRRLFPDGGWSEVQGLAGLERHPQHKESLSDEEILAEFHRVVCELGTIPAWRRFAANAQISDDVVRKRFGGRQGTLARYRAWLELNHPDSPILPTLQTKSRHEVATVATTAPLPISGTRQEWAKADGVEYGAPISFRGLRHAPINEQGVVYLFGMVSSELGLIVEAIQSAFPDCEAKRCVDTSRNRWQRVRIEFEYYSSNFKDHRHDSTLCDMIVCWEHDWAECPLEVIELRSVIDQLEG